MQRRRLIKTFTSRHLPYSDGRRQLPASVLTDPEAWSQVPVTVDTNTVNLTSEDRGPAHTDNVNNQSLTWNSDEEQWEAPEEPDVVTQPKKRRRPTHPRHKKKTRGKRRRKR